MTGTWSLASPTRGREKPGRVALFGVGQGLLTGSVLLAQTLGTLEARRNTGTVTMAGVAVAAQLTGAAVSLAVVRRAIGSSVPRHTVLSTGFRLCAAGLGVAGSAVAVRSLILLLLGSAIFGAGASLALLLRSVALERRPPSARARTVGIVALGGVAGTVLGPAFLALAAVVPAMFVRPVPWWMAAAACAAMAFAIERRLNDARASTALTVARLPDARAAISATMTCAAATAAMVIVMASVTLQLHRLGSSDAVVTSALTAHYAAMYGSAVPFGIAADRLGRRMALIAGALLLTAAGIGLLTDPAHRWLLIAVLVLVGAGWSAAFVTGSAILADAAGSGSHLALTARSDLFVSLTSAMAALAGTAVLAAHGPRGIGVATLAAATVAIVAGLALPSRPPS